MQKWERRDNKYKRKKKMKVDGASVKTIQKIKRKGHE